MRNPPVQTCLWRACVSWYEDNVMRMSSSLAYYTLLSLAPLLVLVVSIAALLWGEDAARGKIAFELTRRVGPEAGEAIEAIILHAQDPAETLFGTIAGVLVLLVGASGVFAELQESMNTVWAVARKPGRAIEGFIRERIASFAMVMSAALLLLLVLLIGALLSVLDERVSLPIPGDVPLWRGIDFVFSLLAVLLLFVLCFKFIPDVRLRWRDVAPGALLATALFALGEIALALYIRKFSVGSPYGAAGSAIVLVVWVYYFFQIMFFGAEFTKARADLLALPITTADHAYRRSPPRP